ncbi:MAG: DNA repair protein RadA [Planctomycetes bacterium]|nr:DNA repair protein RadA [Planctomycetota bacterium]
MAKTKIDFVCQSCGARAPKWLGKCSECGEFNTLVEEVARPEESARRPVLSEERPVPITEVQPVDRPRIVVGIGEFDRVLGGGIVLGSVALIGGDPGIGKSTLILQVCQRIAALGHPVLYISSEESIIQTKLRADRLGVSSPNLFIVSETNLSVIRKYLEEMRPKFAVVDSIQMIYRPELPGAPGTVSQVRECSAELTFLAKRLATSLFIVGHVTKDGSIAGPRTLEHVVDAVFYFEGDRFQTFRLLRGVKNRFGALTTDSAYPENLSRRVSGVDRDRMMLVLAVLNRRCSFSTANQDVFVNAVGGVHIDEPAADLGIAMALASSILDRPVSARTVVFGEVGLTGEVRGVTQAGARVAEAQRLGFVRAIVPKDNLKSISAEKGIEVVGVADLEEAFVAGHLQ